MNRSVNPIGFQKLGKNNERHRPDSIADHHIVSEISFRIENFVKSP